MSIRSRLRDFFRPVVDFDFSEVNYGPTETGDGEHINRPVPGLNLNADGSPWYDKRDPWTSVAPFPHCDNLVLHAPGTCEFCDLYPHSQAARLHMRVAFTNDPVPHPKGFMQCPSTQRRSIETVNLWPGNRARPKEN